MKPEDRLCEGCNEPIENYQVVSGVAVNSEMTIYGHYDCVLTLLGSEMSLKAIQKGLIPSIDPGILVDHRMPNALERAFPDEYRPPYLEEA